MKKLTKRAKAMLAHHQLIREGKFGAALLIWRALRRSVSSLVLGLSDDDWDADQALSAQGLRGNFQTGSTSTYVKYRICA